MHEPPTNAISLIDVCHPDDHFFAWPTGNACRPALKADCVGEVSALRDYRILDICAPSSESACDPTERVGHGFGAVLHRTPCTEERRIRRVRPTVDVGLWIAGAHCSECFVD